MTISMQRLLRRMAARVSRCPERVRVGSPAEFSALKAAWRERAYAHECEGTWDGPGWYRLSGFYDGSRNVAAVEFAKPVFAGRNVAAVEFAKPVFTGRKYVQATLDL